MTSRALFLAAFLAPSASVACGGAPTPEPRVSPEPPPPLPPPPEPALALPPPLPPEPCPTDMVELPAFCIDRYEAPNVRGAIPYALRTAYDGEAWCAARSKRLCSEDEWVRACAGPHGRPFPYGDVHIASLCNDDRRWLPVHWEALAKWPDETAVTEAARLFQGEPSGARSLCVSEEGVFDMTGNVAEWVRRSDSPPRPGYDHVLKGCYWAGCYHEPEPNCAFRNSAHPGSFRTYEAGFRCCRDRGA